MIRRIQNPHAPGPSVALALQRPLFNHAHGRWVRLRPLGQARRDAVAGRRYARRLGHLSLPLESKGQVWSSGWQPVGSRPDDYQVTFAEDRAEFRRRDGAIVTSLEVVVSSEDDAEVRRLTLANEGSEPADIAVTSYAELVMAPEAADIAHQAFAKLFVQTEYYEPLGALLATRRRRAPDEPEVWVGHLLVTDGSAVGKLEFETDRARFLGRCNGVEDAVAIFANRGLSGTVGQVLDPIFALRRRVHDPAGPDQQARLLDHGRFQPRRTLECNVPASQHRELRARRDAGLDPGPGSAASPRDLAPRRPVSSSAWLVISSMPIPCCAHRAT